LQHRPTRCNTTQRLQRKTAQCNPARKPHTWDESPHDAAVAVGPGAMWHATQDAATTERTVWV
jgi:hypothetical protein